MILLVQNHVCFSILLAGVHLDCMFRFPETRNFFRKYSAKGIGYNDTPIFVTHQAFADWKQAGNPVNSFGEFCLMCQPISEALMNNNCCVFHAAALRYHDKAVLIAGGSGVGKSTYCQLLVNNYPDVFSVINGDKPILQCKEGSIVVHPSPWNGKEGMHGADSAPLVCLFLLFRNENDSIIQCSDNEAAIFTFPHVFHSYEAEDLIRKAGDMTQRIVKSTPCFFFHSNNIQKSSELLYDAIKEVCD